MNVTNYIKEYFGNSNVTAVNDNPNVLRCINANNPNNIPYQLIYVDLTNNWQRADFSGYIESQILKDYYDFAGYLQWNFYYYFITETAVLQSNTLQVQRVEIEDSYCRKSILQQEEFISLFESLKNVRAGLSTGTTTDLFATWVNLLRDDKLYFVFDDAKYPNYKQPTEDYINGYIFDENEIGSQNSSDEAVPPLGQLCRVQLNSYRRFPKSPTFDLTRVNLIHGQNAAGKTSLIEAIELAITGKTKSLNTSDYAIELYDKQEQKLSYPETNNQIYKERDKTWYKTGMTRGNNLSGNFKRFNYYTSDAAFELKQSHESNNYNLEKVIEDIALGSEVNKLETRIKEFQNRFRDWVDDLNSLLQKANEDITKKYENIESIKSSTQDFSGYKQALLEVLTQNSWKGELSLIEDQSLIARLESRLKYCLSCAKNIDSNSAPLHGMNVNSLEAIVTDQAMRLSQIKQIRERDRLKKGEVQTIEQSLDSINIAEKAISALKRYFSTSNIEDLLGLNEKIENITSQLDRAKEIEKTYNSLPQPEVEFFKKNQEKELEALYNEALSESQIANNKVKSLEMELAEAEKGLQELQNIYNDLKTLGGRFIHLSEDKTHCPLCNTHFKENELASAILEIKDSFAGSQLFVRLKTDKAVAAETYMKAMSILEYINAIRQFSKANENTAFGPIKSLKDLVHFADLNRKRLTDLNDNLLSINTSKVVFDIEGLSESEFKRLINDYNANSGDESREPFDYTAASDFISRSSAELKQKLATLKNDLQSSEEELKRSITESTEGDLISQYSIFSKAVANVKEIANYFDIKEDDTLVGIQPRIESCLSSFDSFKTAFQENQNKTQGVEILHDQIKITLEQVKDLKEKRSRAQFANEKLSNLLEEHGKSSILSEYLQNNKEEIVKAFSYIHSPNEFSDINITENGVLLVTHEGEQRSLNEISTGQRSALALSIFLSLNLRLTTGPSLLIFDDPVTYVDDLNVLSFIDYLREIALKTDRQIIFATANEDLAFLFSKKFEFLGTEFNRIKLKREG